jgi:hypothetical protein
MTDPHQPEQANTRAGGSSALLFIQLTSQTGGRTMKATLIHKRRFFYSPDAFAESVIWRLPTTSTAVMHTYKYRLAYVVNGKCVLRYDNETGKGDHRHYGSVEQPYYYRSIQQLMADFEADIKRWNNENRDI